MIAPAALTNHGAWEIALVIGLVVALAGIGRINDSGVRLLHSARALRKVAVGK